MNKSELIEAIAAESGLTKADAGKALDALTQTVTDTLKKGDSVSLIGFGTFKVSNRAERQGRNPKTGEPLTIKAAKVPSFSAGKGFKDALK
ncbi:HU family DNA-binding protein [Neisseriaceae bacterium CLB008]|nr:HU family DNA-binding protein [Neisseriaceae bacterium]